MKVPLKWLRDYVDITLSPQELAHRLTMAGSEVSEVLTTSRDWDKISVAQVMDVSPHPNADRLHLATVDLDGERITVVCGAPNVAAGQKVAFARLGAELIDGHSGQPTILKAARIRGVESAGMVCSEKELGLSDYHEGILVLPEDAPIGTPLADYLGDTVLDLDITPNRPDCLSVLGIAREVAALTGQTVREPPLDYPEEGRPAKERAKIEIADRDSCPYCATLIDGVRIGPSPPWLQERLLAAGLRPISNVVDATNYVMLELGQPLHAFDFSRIGGRRIIVRRTRPGETITTLDGSVRPLAPDMLVIADAEEAVAVAGVMGGAASEVGEETTTILLESANFNPTSLRRTSSALKLRTDASLRFEKGLSPDLAVVGVRRATRLILELAGGRAAPGVIDVYPGKQRVTRITVTQERLRKVLGVQLPVSQVRQTLISLGFGCRWLPPDRYVVRVPYWRTDVRIPDDVAEELARIIGYDELPTTTLAGIIPPATPQPTRQLREQVRDILTAAGMQEVITYSLTDREELAKVLSPEELAAHPPLRVANPMSRQQEYLRTTLRASLLETLAANLRYRQAQMVALFETARIYLSRPDDLPQEVECLAGVVSGGRLDCWGHPSEEPVDFFDAKAYLDYLFDRLSLAPTYEDGNDFALLPGRSAEARLDGQRLGLLGQVHPRVAASFDIQQDVFLFELDLETVLPYTGKPRRHQPLSRFPAVEEDIAIVVDEGVLAADVQAIIESFSLVQRATVFDVYTGPPVPAGKKSLAYSVAYQSLEHTLTDADVQRERRRILDRLSRQVGAVLRS